MGSPSQIPDDQGPARRTRSVNEAQMRMVLEVSRLLAVPTDLDVLLKRIAVICCELVDCEVTSIFLHDKKTDQLWTKVAMQSVEIRIPAAKGIVGHSFKTNRLLHVSAPYDDPRFNPEPDRRNGFVTRNLLACPMPDIDGNPLGVIEGINNRGAAFDENDFCLIHLLAEQAAVAIQRHTFQQEALQTMALRREMDLAREIQQNLIPKDPPKVPGLDAVGWNLPASTTGGDCYDLWQTPDGRLGVLVADASGHGLAPALVVSQMRTLVRAFSTIESDPHRLLVHANARLYEDTRNGNFVTAFLAFISSEGEMQWSSAGHGPIFVRRCMDEPLTTLLPAALPLGVDSPWFCDAPPPVRLDAGGSLFVVSDGIFEARSPGGKLFEVERMVALFDEHRQSKPAELTAALREAVDRWQDGREPVDDQTIVIVQRG